MEKFHLRYYNTNALIFTIVILSLGIGLLSDWLQFYGYFIGISTVSTIGSLLFFFDKYLWKYPVFKLLVWTPNLNGRYEGDIDFIHPIEGVQTNKKCVLEIKQTGSKIKIKSFFEKEDNSEQTISRSKVESLIKNDDDTFSIVLTYENRGIVNNSNFPPHYGTNILEVIDNDEGKFLIGEYYTSRNPQTRGTMKVKFNSKKLKNHF